MALYSKHFSVHTHKYFFLNKNVKTIYTQMKNVHKCISNAHTQTFLVWNSYDTNPHIYVFTRTCNFHQNIRMLWHLHTNSWICLYKHLVVLELQMCETYETFSDANWFINEWDQMSPCRQRLWISLLKYNPCYHVSGLSGVRTLNKKRVTWAGQGNWLS